MKDEKQLGVGRREFILMTGGTVLAAVAMGEITFASPAPGRPYSLGYADPDAAVDAAARFHPNVMSADRVSSGDGGLLRGVKVSVRGFNVTPKAAAGRDNIQVITNYSTVEGGELKLHPFVAWSYSKSGGTGQVVSYTVPLDGDQHMRLMLKTDLSATQKSDPGVPAPVARTRRNLFSTLVSEAAVSDSGSDPDAITLSVAGEKGLPKLRAGYYILTPLAEGAPEPDWGRFQLRKSTNGLKLYAMDGFDAVPAPFEYVILQFDALPKDAPARERRQKSK